MSGYAAAAKNIIHGTDGSPFELASLFFADACVGQWARRVSRAELNDVVNGCRSVVGVSALYWEAGRYIPAYQVVAEVRRFLGFVTSVKIGCKTLKGSNARRFVKWAKYAA